MAGPHDRITEQGQSPDPARPREPGRPGAGLQQRMEQLPPGHPSSPYHDDGSRKPPPPDPTDYELPIPGDPSYRPDARGSPQPGGSADTVRDDASAGPDRGLGQKLPAGDRARIGDQDLPEREDRRLSRITDQAVRRCRDAEGRDTNGTYGERGLTPAMRRIESQLEHGRLVRDTEKVALKEADRFKQKLAERIRFQPGESAEVLAARIQDGIRYTFVYDDQKYTAGVAETEADLERSGYELIARKPTWDSPDYKGVNSQWRDPDSGLFFEVQFHTHTSWDAKQTTHLAYERLSDSRTLPEERERLDAYQRQVAASVPVPPGALEIPYYRKKGV
jgi:hypothetical protein